MANERRMRHGVGADDLAWLRGVLWPGAPSDLEPSVGGAEHYRLVPSAERPWILVPVLGVPATWRALRGGARLQTRRQQAIRLAGGAAGLGIPGRLGGGGLAVPAPGGVPARVAETLGRPVRPLLLLGEPDPNRKPVLQLVADDGKTVGYAKVGWNPETRAMVRREAAVLEGLGGACHGRLRTPTVLHAGDHDDLGVTLLVTAPMPAAVKRWSDRRPPPGDVLDELSRALGEQTPRSGQVGALALWDELDKRLIEAARDQPRSVAALRAAVARALATASGEVLVGGWHGDLVPWNLASDGDRVWVWDWEHASAGVPTAWDRLHYRFGVLRHVRRTPTRAALDQVRAEAPALLDGCAAPEAVHAVMLGYLAERWLRALALQRSGGGWDVAVHPVMVDVARAWGSV